MNNHNPIPNPEPVYVIADTPTARLFRGFFTSFFIPGFGQLFQGRALTALVHFSLTALLWLFWLGWLGHIFSGIDAACWKAR